MSEPKVIRMAGWFKIVSAIAAVLLGAGGAYFIINGGTIVFRAAGVGMLLLGILGFVDTLMSRIVLEDETIEIVSLVRRMRHSRAEFDSARVDGGVVVLKRCDGGWLKLPGTGHNTLSVRNTVHAWIKRGT